MTDSTAPTEPAPETHGPDADRALPARSISRRTLLATSAIAPLGLALGTGRADAAIAPPTIKIVQEPDPDEARIPDILRHPNGTIIAVWHKGPGHFDPGVIRVAYSTNATTWSTPHNALYSSAPVAGRDTRDPKLSLLNDGTVILTFFTKPGNNQGYQVWYSVWRPGWEYFTEPKLFSAAGPAGMLEHGGVLALRDNGSFVNEVLVPIYYGGAWFVRAQWNSSSQTLTAKAPARQLIANTSTVEYTEPSFVQIGDWVVCMVRSDVIGDPHGRLPSIHYWWRAYETNPTIYKQTLNIKASSHHLLKTSDGKVLLTYGDGAITTRPTKGLLISNPADVWNLATPTPIYDLGTEDSANPSSIEMPNGTFYTTGINTKTRAESPYGGTLWLISSTRADYQ